MICSLTESFSSILKATLLKPSPTLLNSFLTLTPDKVLVCEDLQYEVKVINLKYNI